MPRPVVVLSCLVLSVVPWQTLAAQSGGIRGRVTESGGAALARASVSIDGTTFVASSNDRGEYEFRAVPPGTHTVRVRALGYVPAAARVTVAAGAVARQDFALAAHPIGLAAIDVVVGSRARHTAAEELAVPVDVFPIQDIRAQGTTETAQILSQLSPSVNFPRQSVADASDIVRPFTMRGLSPDHSLVLVNGRRRHRTALVHYFGAALGAGSSGVDMNAIPASAIERIEVLRDGAAAQYGSDAIAGVVNVVLREGAFAPSLSASAGRYVTGDYPDDGEAYNVSGGWGLSLGRGSLGLFGEYRHRDPTNRAGADPFDQIEPGDADLTDPATGRLIQKNNPVPQPNHHWGDGSSRDWLGFATYRAPVNPAGSAEFYGFGGYSFREGTGNGFRRQAIDDRNWPSIYPQGFLPEFDADVVDASAAAGVRGARDGWRFDVGASWGHNEFEFNLTNTLNTSLGPCLTFACAPGLDGRLGTADDPGIPNQTEFFAGALRLSEVVASVDLSRAVGRHNVAFGGSYRYETYRIEAGERASWIQGGHVDRNGNQAPPGSQVFPGFQPGDEADASRDNYGAYVDVEANLSSALLVNVAARFEDYSDFGSRLTEKLAVRLQPSPRITFRGAVSTGFRAPSLSQSHYSSTVTNFVGGEPFEVGIFPVADTVARTLGAEPLREETSTNLSGGVVISPNDDLTLSGDLYFIAVDGRILMTAELGGEGTAVADRLEAAGVSAVAARYMTNALNTETVGLDLTANWDLPLGGNRLNLNFVLNYTRTEVVDSTPLPPELSPAALGGEQVARFDRLLEGGLNAIEAERPRWRWTLTGRYATPRWSATLRGAYYGDFHSTLLNYAQVDTYPGKLLVDAELSRSFAGGQVVAVGARNLFDTYPGRIPLANNVDGIFSYPSASPFGFNGRFVYLRMDLPIAR
jgi:iron complex outermembrane receptor protein